MDRRLGRPLPCQLANPTRVHLIPPEFFTPYHAVLCAYAVLAAISNCYPPVWGRLPTRYSPVRHSVTKDFIRRICPKCFVRLACVKHAASVHPEPGSNSLNKCLLQVKINSWLIYPFYCFLRIFRSFVFMILKRTFEECVSLFSYQRSFCIAVCLKQLCYYIMSFPACQELFSTFLKLFLFLSCSNFDILSHPTSCCQELFSFLFDSFVISVRSLRRNSDRIPPLPGFVNTFFNFSYNLFIHVFYYISDTWLTHQYIVS